MNRCVIWKYTVLWILSIKRYYSELLKREVVHGWVWFDYVLVSSRRLTHLLLCPSHLIFWVNCGGGVKEGGHLAATCAASSILNRNGKCSKKNPHRSSFVRLDFLPLVWIGSQDARSLSTLSSVGGPRISPIISAWINAACSTSLGKYFLVLFSRVFWPCMLEEFLPKTILPYRKFTLFKSFEA